MLTKKSIKPFKIIAQDLNSEHWDFAGAENKIKETFNLTFSMPELKEDGFSLADYCDQFVDKLKAAYDDR